MRLREFLSVLTPEDIKTCGRLDFFKNNKPVCPIAKAAVKRGYVKEGSVKTVNECYSFYESMGLENTEATDQFILNWDLNMSFEQALEVAEQYED